MKSPNPARRTAFAALSLLVIAVLAPEAAASTASTAPDDARLRAQLELFVPLAPDDSIASIRAAASDTLEASLVSGQGTTRTARAFVPPRALERLVASARRAASLSSPPSSPSSSPPPPPSEERAARLRTDYMGGQMTATMFVYAIALSNALRLEDGAGILLPTLATTGGLAAHAAFSYGTPLTAPQVMGMNAAAGAAILTSFAAPVAVLGLDGTSVRIGSAVSLFAYPLALVPGYRYGSAYQGHSSQLSKKIFAAGLFSGLGAALPWAYYRDFDADLYGRTAAVQSLAFGAAGFFAADLWRPDGEIPEGVATGVMTHTALGALVGSAMWATSSPSDGTTGMRLLLGASTVGFTEGLFFFKDRNDSEKQAMYAGFGLSGGALVASAFALSAGAGLAPSLWLISGGAIAGYAIGYSLVAQQTADRVDVSDDDVIRRASLRLAPVPEAVRVTDARSGRESWDLRYRVPGLVVRF